MYHGDEPSLGGGILNIGFLRHVMAFRILFYVIS